MIRYRIQRTDTRNITIQRKWSERDKWRTISYHGNSASSLVSGLFNLIMSQYTPADEELLKQLKKLELELVSGQDKIIELIKENIE